MKKLLLLLFAVVLIVGTIVVYRAATYQPVEAAASGARVAAKPAVPVDADGIARRVGEAIRFRTISQSPPLVTEAQPFEDFIAWMATTYPELHRTLSLERVGGKSLLYTWRGKDPAAKPICSVPGIDGLARA